MPWSRDLTLSMWNPSEYKAKLEKRFPPEHLFLDTVKSEAFWNAVSTLKDERIWLDFLALIMPMSLIAGVRQREGFQGNPSKALMESRKSVWADLNKNEKTAPGSCFMETVTSWMGDLQPLWEGDDKQYLTWTRFLLQIFLPVRGLSVFFHARNKNYPEVGSLCPFVNCPMEVTRSEPLRLHGSLVTHMCQYHLGKGTCQVYILSMVISCSKRLF